MKNLKKEKRSYETFRNITIIRGKSSSSLEKFLRLLEKKNQVDIKCNMSAEQWHNDDFKNNSNTLTRTMITDRKGNYSNNRKQKYIIIMQKTKRVKFTVSHPNS